MRSIIARAALPLLGIGFCARLLLAPTAAAAGPPVAYTATAILHRGDKVGNTTYIDQSGFGVDSLTDSGQLLFVGYLSDSQTLWQYANGTFTPIVIPNLTGPTVSGRWPHGYFFSPVSMNQKGDAVFTMFNGDQGGSTGVFKWDATAKTTTAVELPGKPATKDLTFSPFDYERPSINNKGEIAFPAAVKNAAGQVGSSLFFRGQDGTIQPVVLPGAAGPDGVPFEFVDYPSLNDAGRISFRALRYGQARPSAFLWDSGHVIPIALVGDEVPTQGVPGKIVQVTQAWVNNHDSDVLVEVVLNHLDTGPEALYRWSNGQLAPVVAPGTAMPGGGTFLTLLYDLSVSYPNEAGQHAFYGLVADGGATRSGAYILNPDATLSVIVRSGDTNEIGTIARVGDPDENTVQPGCGIALNGKGQVAIILKPVGAPQVLSLLTPAAQ